MDSCQVLVVGAGPAGALLSLLLAERGVETVLVERQRDFSREFRGEILMPSGFRMLREAGVALEDVPHRPLHHLELYMNADRFLDLPFGDDHGGDTPMAVSQPEFLEHLVQRAERTGCFQLLRGAVAREVLFEGDRAASVRLDGGAPAPRASFLVGADGRASVLRRGLDNPVRERGAPMDIVWFKLPLPEHWPVDRVRFHLGGGHLLVAVPAPDGLLQLAWVILKGHYGVLRKRGVEEWVAEMSAHVDAELGRHIERNAGEIVRPFLLDSETDRVEGWFRPGLLVIGDAAHTMSPVGGQGLNVAMRDAVVAANQLVPAAGDPLAMDAGAQRVEAERGPEIDTIQRLAALPPRVVMGRRFFHAWIRRAVATLAPIAIARRGGASPIDTFLNGTREVRLEV